MDGTNAKQFDEDVNEELGADDEGVVLDLSGLVYISSAGLRTILVMAKTLQQRTTKLALCALNPSIFEIFQIAGFDRILTIVDSREKAVAAVGS